MIWAAGKGRVVVACAKCATSSITQGFASIGRTPLDRRDKQSIHSFYTRAREINLVIRSPEERLFSAYQMYYVGPARALKLGQEIDQSFAVNRKLLLRDLDRYINDPLWGFTRFLENDFERMFLSDAHFAPQWSIYGYPVVMFPDRVRLWRMDQLTAFGEYLGIEIPHENRQRWLWTHTNLYQVLNAAPIDDKWYKEDGWLWARAKA
jgi:hypothetical protein